MWSIYFRSWENFSAWRIALDGNQIGYMYQCSVCSQTVKCIGGCSLPTAYSFNSPQFELLEVKVVDVCLCFSISILLCFCHASDAFIRFSSYLYVQILTQTFTQTPFSLHYIVYPPINPTELSTLSAHQQRSLDTF